MDRVVDHLLVFNGEGRIDDFPGNYSEYREWRSLRDHEEQEAREMAKSAAPTPQKTNTWGGEKKRRLSFKEKQELAALESEIASLETEKKTIEEALCSGTLLRRRTDGEKQTPAPDRGTT